MLENKYWNIAQKKMEKEYTIEITKNLCSWSDLLGFGSVFTQSNWNPDKTQWIDICKRLVDVQNISFEHFLPFETYSLVLNDGIVDTYGLQNVAHIQHVSIWIRNRIFFHIRANVMEKHNGNPGIRTVLASGQRANHNFEDLKLDDFVANYSKPDSKCISNIAQKTGNPIMCYNPSALQMNTAFSKAYIIDNIGSKGGIGGPNFFVDQSVIDELKTLKQQFNSICDDIIWIEYDDKIHFGIPLKSEPKRYHIGFEFSNPPIDLDTNSLSSKVWKTNKFFCHDEPIDDYSINLNEYTSTTSDVGISIYQSQKYMN